MAEHIVQRHWSLKQVCFFGLLGADDGEEKGVKGGWGWGACMLGDLNSTVLQDKDQ